MPCSPHRLHVDEHTGFPNATRSFSLHTHLPLPLSPTLVCLGSKIGMQMKTQLHLVSLTSLIFLDVQDAAMINRQISPGIQIDIHKSTKTQINAFQTKPVGKKSVLSLILLGPSRMIF